MSKLTEIEAFKRRVGREPTDPSFVREPHHEPDDDDLGLPEDPISSNYSKYLWKGHSENRRIPNNSRLTKNSVGNEKFK